MRALRSFGLLMLVSVFLSMLLAGPALALQPTDGWQVKLVPGTDKIDSWRDPQIPDGAIGPGPDIFSPEVALDGDHLVYSARYEAQPQIYLYEISTGKVSQLSSDLSAGLTAPLVSGNWAAWLGDWGRSGIYLRNLESGATQTFTAQTALGSFRLKGDRLAWAESDEGTGGPGTESIWLYDPAVGSPQKVVTAAWGGDLDLDDTHLVWVGGSDRTEIWTYDFQRKESTKVTTAAQPVESVTIGGQVIAWAERTGERTTMVAYRLDRRERKVLDTFGPFNPGQQTDGRYVVWTGGENATGSRVAGYDTLRDRPIELDTTGFQGGAPSLDEGRVAWLRSFSGRGRSVVMVKDLSSGLATQLSNGPSESDSRPPAMSGGTVVWALYNPEYRSPLGHGVLVATSPATPPTPAFADLGPGQLYRTAIEWLGEAGYATGYPGAAGQEYRFGQPQLRSQLALLVCRVFAIPISDTPVHFADFDTSQPGSPLPAQAQATLAELGIFKGTSAGLMQAYAPVSRAQAITVLVRAFDYIHPGLLPASPDGYVEPKFTDIPHGDNVTRAGWDCLLDGLGGYALYRGDGWVPWDIWATTTRGEVAQLLWNATGMYLQP